MRGRAITVPRGTEKEEGEAVAPEMKRRARASGMRSGEGVVGRWVEEGEDEEDAASAAEAASAAAAGATTTRDVRL